jgi:FtsH-binding integral membrane protein
MFVLIPHIIFIFFAMMFANVAGLLAAFKMPKYKLFTIITLVGIFIGGLILGPIVQKYAFNEFWAGVPFGWDLTDNKLLIAFIFWLLAYAGNRKSEKAYLTIIAAIVTLIVFSIPHSMFGSELNRETGNVTQGFINFIKPLFY